MVETGDAGGKDRKYWSKIKQQSDNDGGPPLFADPCWTLLVLPRRKSRGKQRRRKEANTQDSSFLPLLINQLYNLGSA